MIPEQHQSIEEVLKNASPEQKIQWQAIRLITGEKAAVRQLSWSTLYGGSDPGLTVFIANRLFFALQIDFGCSQPVDVNRAQVFFYNNANALSFSLQNNAMVYNPTTLQHNYLVQNVSIKNLIFWRYQNTLNYPYVNFIGYVIVY